MAHVIDGVALDLERLNQRVRELESRVSTLESQQRMRGEQSSNALPKSPDLSLQRPHPPATWRGFPAAEFPGGAVPVLGKAVLGIAGAYLLRAIAESNSVPKLPILLLAIVYAALWIVWAVRTHAASRFASVTYAFTSVLILSPLLWESTVRFQTLAPSSTATVLVAFTVFALALSWRLDLQLIPWIATLATVLTAVALIVQTHELVPLTAALLAVALAAEAAACLEHCLTLRAVPALAADFAVWLLVFVMTSPDGVPEGYPPASTVIITTLCLLLFAIYGASIAIRTFARRHPVTLFEIGQGILAFVLATFGVMRATHSFAAPAFGVFALLLAVACYWGVLSRFTAESHGRNRRTSATYAAVLLLIGSYLLLSPTLLVPFLSLAAVASAFLYARTDKLSLGIHASFYLAAATAASTLPHWIVAALAGTLPTYPDSSVWTVAVSSALCYILGSWGTQADQSQTKRRMLWVVPAALVSFASAAIAIAAVGGLVSSRLELTPSRLSVVRTIVNCALALVLAFLGSRWKHIELSWVAYAAVAFGTVKLIFEDLRFGNASSLVVSLLCYGLVLILLPRITRRSESPVG